MPGAENLAKDPQQGHQRSQGANATISSINKQSIKVPSKFISLCPQASAALRYGREMVQWIEINTETHTDQSAENKCQWSHQSQMGHL